MALRRRPRARGAAPRGADRRRNAAAALARGPRRGGPAPAARAKAQIMYGTPRRRLRRRAGALQDARRPGRARRRGGPPGAPGVFALGPSFGCGACGRCSAARIPDALTCPMTLEIHNLHGVRRRRTNARPSSSPPQSPQDRAGRRPSPTTAPSSSSQSSSTRRGACRQRSTRAATRRYRRRVSRRFLSSERRRRDAPPRDFERFGAVSEAVVIGSRACAIDPGKERACSIRYACGGKCARACAATRHHELHGKLIDVKEYEKREARIEQYAPAPPAPAQPTAFSRGRDHRVLSQSPTFRRELGDGAQADRGPVERLRYLGARSARRDAARTRRGRGGRHAPARRCRGWRASWRRRARLRRREWEKSVRPGLGVRAAAWRYAPGATSAIRPAYVCDHRKGLALGRAGALGAGAATPPASQCSRRTCSATMRMRTRPSRATRARRRGRATSKWSWSTRPRPHAEPRKVLDGPQWRRAIMALPRAWARTPFPAGVLVAGRSNLSWASSRWRCSERAATRHRRAQDGTLVDAPRPALGPLDVANVVRDATGRCCRTCGDIGRPLADQQERRGSRTRTSPTVW